MGKQMNPPNRCCFPKNLYWDGYLQGPHFCKKGARVLHLSVITREPEKPLFTCLAMTLTCSVKSSNKKLCDKNAKACLSEKILLVQRVSFTPGSQVLSAGSSEHCHCKTKDSSNWHDNGTISRHFKSSRHCTGDAPSLSLPGMFTHTLQQLTPQQRPGSIVKGTALTE